MLSCIIYYRSFNHPFLYRMTWFPTQNGTGILIVQFLVPVIYMLNNYTQEEGHELKSTSDYKCSSARL